MMFAKSAVMNTTKPKRDFEIIVMKTTHQVKKRHASTQSLEQIPYKHVFGSVIQYKIKKASRVIKLREIKSPRKKTVTASGASRGITDNTRLESTPINIKGKTKNAHAGVNVRMS